MISGTASCFPNASQMYNPVTDQDIVSSSLEAASSNPDAHSTSLLYNLSILKDKVHQVQSLVSIIISPDHQTAQQVITNPESTSLALANMGSLVQEIIVTASSMIFVCQQMSLGTASSISAGNNNNQLHQQHVRVPEKADYNHNIVQERGQGYYSTTDQTICSWLDKNDNDGNGISTLQVSFDQDHKVERNNKAELAQRREISEGSRSQGISSNTYDIIELDAADLLAKYTHYCQVCGKGFKRDANLRMHMRAHGDEYKTSAALTNPMKNHNEGSGDMGMGPNCSTKLPKKYSCPQEGCRWNQKHAKFQPLKSMICVKNHYKRSHCPKMYVCKRCNRKQFSVLSDLRTHEKHCGDLKWLCSCGTTFSRKDKLMGHVALFVGHSPVVTAGNSLSKPVGKLENQATAATMQIDDRYEIMKQLNFT